MPLLQVSQIIPICVFISLIALDSISVRNDFGMFIDVKVLMCSKIERMFN